MQDVNVEKGSVVQHHGWWFVVVEQHGNILYCICDNANNIYSHQIEECPFILNPYEAMRAHGWGDGEEKLMDAIREREIPAEVIAEVLSGCHDKRFSHWSRE